LTAGSPPFRCFCGGRVKFFDSRLAPVIPVPLLRALFLVELSQFSSFQFSVILNNLKQLQLMKLKQKRFG
jgi:hypothetical protein